MSKYLLDRVRLAEKILGEIEEYLTGADDLTGATMNGKGASPFRTSKNDKKEIENAIRDQNHDYKMDPNDECPICPDGMDPDEFMNQISGQTQRETAALASVANSEKEMPGMPSLKEGSIIKRGDGRWMGRYRINGAYKSVYATTKPAIIEKVNALVRERDLGDKDSGVSKKMTLIFWVNTWFEEYKQGRSRSKPLKPSTIENVDYTLIQSVETSKIGKKIVSNLTPRDIDEFLDSIETKSMQARVFSYLHMCLQKLVMKKILKENICDQVEYRARPDAKKKYIPDYESMHKFLDWLRVRSFETYLFAKFLASTGMRKGEALALTWADVDFKNEKISVNKEYDTRTRKILDDPKTPAAVRDVPLFDEAKEVLNEIKKKTGEVFYFISKANITHLFPRIAAEFGMKLPLHNLRHYFSTQCLEKNVDSKTASKWMGHASFDLRINTYSHINHDFEQEQILKLAKRGSKKEKF